MIFVIYLLTYKINFLRRRLGKYLFWNTLIRLFCEMFFEMFLLATLNIKTIDWDSPFVGVLVSNIAAIAVVVVIISTQIAIFWMYLRKEDKW